MIDDRDANRKDNALGPLRGVKILEFAGIGPAPFCGMLLSDLGADVLRVDRKGGARRSKYEILARGRRSVALDLKAPEARAACLDLMEAADILIESNRPGVMERLGLGPEKALARNPKLVYGRMTGWGQDGPLSQSAGHDINYIAITGALHAVGRANSPPTPPLNLVGNFGGGALYLAMGVLAALRHADHTGQGQVVDVAISDAVSSMMAWYYWFAQEDRWSLNREDNISDGGAPFFAAYECKDGLYVSIGPLEGPFYDLLLKKLGVDDPDLAQQWNRANWPAMREKFAQIFKTKTRAQWDAELTGTDVCFAPVLRMDEAADHPHNAARRAIVRLDGVTQPAPAPRFSVTPATIQGPPSEIGHGGAKALRDWGLSADVVEKVLGR